MSDNLNLVKRQREISEASYKMRDNIYRPVNETADALEAKDAEIDYWKNRTREALETIKDNVERIAELQQIVARIVEHNDIDSQIPEYKRWEILVADARKVIEDNVADWEAHYRDLGEKEDNFTER